MMLPNSPATGGTKLDDTRPSSNHWRPNSNYLMRIVINYYPAGDRRPLSETVCIGSLPTENRAKLINRVAPSHYEATTSGRELLAKPLERITVSYLNKIRSHEAVRQATGKEEVSAIEATTINVSTTPEERLEAADRDLKDEVAATLRTRLQGLSSVAFEQLIIDVLVKIGYGGSRRDAAQRLGRSGDGGIDGVIHEDVLGLDTIYVQAKRYSDDNTVGPSAIQGFAGALLEHGATKGVFVTTSRFTQAALRAGAAYKAHRIVLIDGAELSRLMIENEVGVQPFRRFECKEWRLNRMKTKRSADVVLYQPRLQTGTSGTTEQPAAVAS